jgi:hypothetical protein
VINSTRRHTALDHRSSEHAGLDRINRTSIRYITKEQARSVMINRSYGIIVDNKDAPYV